MNLLRVHYSHRGMKKHKVSVLTRFNLYVLVPVVILLVVSGIGISKSPVSQSVDVWLLVSALGASCMRLFVAYVLSLVIGIMFAIWATSSKKAETLLLPLFDVLESVPVLAFFPVIIVFFVRFEWFDAAAVIILSLNMIWNIVFNAIEGIKVIPQDIRLAAKVFDLSYVRKLTRIVLPAIFPSLVTGSLLAWAEGWNMLIVAEVLKNYAPQTTGAGDLFGIGSLLVNASTSGNNSLFLGTVAVIVIAVIVLNIFVWQPLLRFSQRFVFDS